MIKVKFVFEEAMDDEDEGDDHDVLYATINNTLYSYDYSDDETSFLGDLKEQYPNITPAQLRYWEQKFIETEQYYGIIRK